MYEKQKREFEGFLTGGDRGSGVGQEMNRISERQQEESKGNTTRMLKEAKAMISEVGSVSGSDNRKVINENKIRKEV